MRWGAAGLSAIHDTLIQAQVTVPRKDGPVTTGVTIRTMGTSSLRVEASPADGPSILTLNNQQAWLKVGTDPAEYIPRVAIASAGITYVPLLSILANWSDPGMRVEYIGLEKLGISTAHHVRLTPPLEDDLPPELESPCDIFIDPLSFLVLKLIYVIRPPASLVNKVSLEIAYSDYRAVSGILIPYRLTHTINGQLARDYRVTSFSVNLGAQPGDFEVR